MDAFTLDDLMAAREQSGRLYHEFLRVQSMSAGVYQLAAGSANPQQPRDLYIRTAIIRQP